MDRKEIEAARKAGVLDDAKAAELEAFIAAERGPGASSDDENLRFLANFNDIFISIGIVLLTIGLSIGSALVLGSTGNAFIISLPVLVAVWAMLEYFAGRRRLLLPSMTLSLLFTWFAMLLVGLIAAGFGSLHAIEDTALSGAHGPLGVLGSISRGLESFGFWSAAGAGLASAIIYFRFRLPFALFLMAVAIAVGLYTFAFSTDGAGSIIGGTASFLIGLGTLLAAIFFDAQDPERKSLSSDNAFWLHFAAAPQIMLGLRAIFSGGTYSSLSGPEAIPLLLALAGFSILSLALNRRALIAAGLLSFWVAISAIASPGDNEAWGVAVPLLLLGGGIVLLGAGWKTARRIVLRFVPQTGAFARIFPPEPA
jgi:hypothetical protein